jgi:hypothetical protein
MTIALSILFAAIVGGTVFALMQSAFDRRDRAAQAAPTEPLPHWEPRDHDTVPQTQPLPDPAPEPPRRDGLWAGWARD